MRFSRHIFLIMTALTLVFGCKKTVEDTLEPVVTSILPYSVTVQPEKETRASFSGSSIGEGQYIFAEGDKLYITGAEGQIYGELSLASGAGTGSATFSGDLTCTGGFEPTASTILTATLVGSSQAGSFFTVSGGRISSGPNYPSELAYNASITDIVEHYSHFTSSFPYSLHKFYLNQQTVFLNFGVELYRSDLIGDPSSVTMEIKESDGSTLIRRITGVPVTGSSTIAKIKFVSVFPSGTDLQGAQTWINNGAGIHCLPDFSEDLNLEENKYYRVIRSAVDDFTVEAPSSGSGASVTFNYGPVQYKEYKGGSWSDWADYSSTISLSPGEKVSFRGHNSSYANTTGSTPLITTVNNVYLYGDIMSLICDENYDRQTEVGSQAFYQAFMGLSTINIHPDKELILSAETLNQSCYEGMFANCSGLNKTPILPATIMADMCYHRMFYDCDALSTLPEGLLPSTTLAFGCYWKMFENCGALASVPSNLLPATTLATACYARMFYQCGNSFTTAPDLPAINPAPACYFNMFRHSKKLKYVKCMLYLEGDQLAGGEIPGYYKKDDNPPAEEFRKFLLCTMYTIFNKWLNDTTNANTSEYVYNENMAESTCNISIAGATLVPGNWKKTPVAP